MSTSTRRSASGRAPAGCPAWCDADRADRGAVNHTRLTGAVLRDLHQTSVAVEIEQAVDGRLPTIVLSVFTQKKLRGMSAKLAVDEARRAHDALGEALRLADETVR